MKLGVYEGQSKINEIEVNSIVGEKSESLLYQAMVSRLSQDRQGTLSTLTKSEVRGGGKKPWKQKGLGRARAGSIRSPLWRGGGVTFGPKPRDFSKDINRKQKGRAFVTVFTKIAEADKLKVIKDISFDTPKTKDFLVKFSAYNPDNKENVVIIIPEYNKSMVLASRNLQKYKVLSVQAIDLLPLVYADQVLITEQALKALETKFQ